MDTPLEKTEVSFRNYGDYSSSNYGAHSLEFNIGNISLYFSYKTVIAFHTPATGLKVCENIWGNTTGKHLNWIDGGNKKDRLSHSEFSAQLNEALEKYNLNT